jgi:glucosamine-6-phosphate deaminase
MNINITQNARELGKAAGAAAAGIIRKAIHANGEASIILATGASQFETLNQLVAEKEIDWSRVSVFHLDEYIGLPMTHPAGFRKYLHERFFSKLQSLKAACLINGEADANQECARLGGLIGKYAIDLALVGIGENGHLAFNDPPADFDTEAPFIVVKLDDACRRQQLGEGWFKNMEDVPDLAISMSVKQILKSKCIICSVPDSRKALAVKNTIELAVSNLYPASILRLHPGCDLFLDISSAALLSANGDKKI